MGVQALCNPKNGDEVTTRAINQDGINIVKEYEGLRLKPYICPAGKWTVGYGHTGNVNVGVIISEEKANQLLANDLSSSASTVESLVKVALNHNQFSALVSFAFNVGSGSFSRSTLLRKLNAGNYGAVPEELKRWVKAGGKPLSGLVSRRLKESELWSRPCTGSP